MSRARIGSSHMHGVRQTEARGSGRDRDTRAVQAIASNPCWIGAAQGRTSVSTLHGMPSAREAHRVGRGWFCICVQCSVHCRQSRKNKLYTSSTVHILRPAACRLWTHILILSIVNLVVNVFSLIQLKWPSSLPFTQWTVLEFRSCIFAGKETQKAPTTPMLCQPGQDRL